MPCGLGWAASTHTASAGGQHRSLCARCRFQLVCGFPHSSKRPAATWAPKAHKWVESYSQTLKRAHLAGRRPISSQEGCRAGRGEAGGPAASSRGAAPEGWPQAQGAPPPTFLPAVGAFPGCLCCWLLSHTGSSRYQSSGSQSPGRTFFQISSSGRPEKRPRSLPFVSFLSV